MIMIVIWFRRIKEVVCAVDAADDNRIIAKSIVTTDFKLVHYMERMENL